jgi:hypothetical protein
MYYSTIKTPIYVNYNIPYELRGDYLECISGDISGDNKIMFLDKNVIFFAQQKINKKTNEIVYIVDKHDGTQLIYTENIDKYKLIGRVK